MVSVSSPFEYQSLLEMGNLVIADFFVPWCQACRALHPKLKQIAQQNPDVLFLTVNGGDDSELRELCVGLGVTKLPYFHLYRGGELIEQFAANLTKVDKIRAEIAALKQDPFEEMGFTSFGRLDSLPPI
ncbi:hypothetical protein WJX72_003017 [[Myrmecia] bisecta]|uniref:Thioredoxin domain-containing protein n=1 Tax=[Myrmecia] bisecta TaxID=41462 RepID=A0AAW1Q9Z2_9CHLO